MNVLSFDWSAPFPPTRDIFNMNRQWNELKANTDDTDSRDIKGQMTLKRKVIDIDKDKEKTLLD